MVVQRSTCFAVIWRLEGRCIRTTLQLLQAAYIAETLGTPARRLADLSPAVERLAREMQSVSIDETDCMFEVVLTRPVQ